MVKVIIQIPCLNEAATLPQVIASLPRSLSGVDQIEFLVIDDGSSDETSQIAVCLGVNHVVRHNVRCGLAAAFSSGLRMCVKLDADVIVNTDGDNQYYGEDISRLIEPILLHKADLVIGDRQTRNIRTFPWWKRILQSSGSAIVSRIAGVHVRDASSGFRALTRNAADACRLTTNFSHTLETLFIASSRGWRIETPFVRTNPPTRQSRLFRNTAQYLWRSVGTVVHCWLRYRIRPLFHDTASRAPIHDCGTDDVQQPVATKGPLRC